MPSLRSGWTRCTGTGSRRHSRSSSFRSSFSLSGSCSRGVAVRGRSVSSPSASSGSPRRTARRQSSSRQRWRRRSCSTGCARQSLAPRPVRRFPARWWRHGIVAPVALAVAGAAVLGAGVAAHVLRQAERLGDPVDYRFFEPDWLSWRALDEYLSTGFLALAAVALLVLVWRRSSGDAALLAVASLVLGCVAVSQLWRLGIAYEYRRVVYPFGLAFALLVGAAAARIGRWTIVAPVGLLACAVLAHQSVGFRLPQRLSRRAGCPTSTAPAALDALRGRIERGEPSGRATCGRRPLSPFHRAVPARAPDHRGVRGLAGRVPGSGARGAQGEERDRRWASRPGELAADLHVGYVVADPLLHAYTGAGARGTHGRPPAATFSCCGYRAERSPARPTFRYAAATSSSDASIRNLDAFASNHRLVDSRSDGPAPHRSHECGREALRRGVGRHEPVDAVLDELDRRVLGPRHDDARRSVRGRLDDDETVALALGSGRDAGGARHRGVDLGLGPLARQSTASPTRAPSTTRAIRPCSGPSPYSSSRSSGSSTRATANARTRRSTRFSRTCRPAYTTSVGPPPSAASAPSCPRRARQHDRRPAVALGHESVGVHL